MKELFRLFLRTRDILWNKLRPQHFLDFSKYVQFEFRTQKHKCLSLKSSITKEKRNMENQWLLFNVKKEFHSKFYCLVFRVKKLKDGVTQIVIFWLMLYRKSDRIMKNNQVLIPVKINCDHTRWSSFEENN